MPGEPLPASLHGQDRVDAVVAKHDTAATTAQATLPDLRAKELSYQTEEGGTQDTQEQAFQAENSLEQVKRNIQQETEKFFGLGGLLGRKDRAERESAAQKSLNEAMNRRRQAENRLATTRNTIGEVEDEMIREEVVAEANKLGGPLESSEALTQSLSRQDLLQKLAKEGYLDNSPGDTKFMPTMDMYKETVAALIDADPKDDWNGKAREKAEKRVLDILPVVENITKYCHENGIPLSEKLMQRAIVEGFGITQGVTGKDTSEVWRFLAEKKGRHVQASDIGYYEVGAYQLDRFFKHRPNIQGINRVPYVIAYAAGAIENGAPMHMAQHTRDWLAEVIPAQGMDVEWKGESGWQVVSDEPQSLGLGHLASLNMWNSRTIFEGETHRPGLIEIAQKAKQLVGEMYKGFAKRRRFDAQRHFMSGINWVSINNEGIPDFPVPRPEKS